LYLKYIYESKHVAIFVNDKKKISCVLTEPNLIILKIWILYLKVLAVVSKILFRSKLYRGITMSS